MEKELTRQEQIEDLQAEYDRRLARSEALQKQHDELVISLKKMDAAKAKQIEKTLDNLPDATPKGIVDKVLQLPDEKRGQILGNTQKLQIAALNEKRKAYQADEEKNRILNEIEQERINKHTEVVFKKFYKWLENYLITKDYFRNSLIPAIEEGYRLDPYFQTRSDSLGLSKTVAVSIESHFRDGSLKVIGMPETIEKIANLGAAYGERLLDKEPSPTETHPFQDSSYFGIQPSDKPPLQDPIND